MTFEEFNALAMNPPYTYEPAVYRIDVFRVQEPDNGKSCFSINPWEDIRETLSRIDDIPETFADADYREYYPTYRVCKSESFILPTIEDARQFIQSGRISNDDYRPIFCIHVYELPFGKDVISDLCKREWVFDGEFNLVNQSACSSLLEDLDKPEGHFWGRPKESIHFRPGDIVEVHDRIKGTVRLAVVVSLHNDIDTCWRDYQDTVKLCEIEGIGVEFADDNYSRYACDDCIGVVDGPDPIKDHSCPYTTDVFAPRFPIPAELRKHLNECYNIAVKALSNKNDTREQQE